MSREPIPGRYDAGRLDGLRILVPRGGAWGERVAAQIRHRGGTPVIAPLIEIAPPEEVAPLEEAARAWNRRAYDWLVVTSANGVEAFVGAGAVAAPGTAGARVAAVGPATAGALRQHGFSVHLVPPREFSASGLREGILTALGERSARVLLPVSDLAGDTLETALRAAGHRVDRVTAYRTVPAAEDPALAAVVAAGEFDAILVTSGSVADVLADRLAPIPPRTGLAAIGDPSARALAAHGIGADVVASVHTVEGLLAGVADRRAAHPSTADPSTADPNATDQETE